MTKYVNVDKLIEGLRRVSLRVVERGATEYEEGCSDAYDAVASMLCELKAFDTCIDLSLYQKDVKEVEENENN